MVNGQTIFVLNLDEDVERWWRLALEDRLLRPTPFGLLIAQCDSLNAANEIAERGIHEEVLQGIPVRRRDELNAAFGDRAGGERLGLRPDLVNDDHFGHVILNGFDHDSMLQFW